MFFNLVSVKEHKREEEKSEGNEKKKRAADPPLVGEWQDKRRKGFKPRTRDKLACPAGGPGF